MLLKGIAVLSLLSAAFFHIRFDPALWLTLAVFAGSALALLLAAFLFLCLVCAAVDLDKPQETDSRFYLIFMHMYIEALIPLV